MHFCVTNSEICIGLYSALNLALCIENKDEYTVIIKTVFCNVGVYEVTWNDRPVPGLMQNPHKQTVFVNLVCVQSQYSGDFKAWGRCVFGSVFAGGHQRRFKRELERMGFDTHSAWRISTINSNYRWNSRNTHTHTPPHTSSQSSFITSRVCVWSRRLCASYPEQIIVPAAVSDQELENVAAFRSWKRIPVVVYRCFSVCTLMKDCSGFSTSSAALTVLTSA